jgi:hypothetical protein
MAVETAPDARPVASWPTVSARAAARYLRAVPVTAGYLVFLLLSHIVVFDMLPARRTGQVLAAISTNVATLPHRPLRTLIGSALVSVPGSDLVTEFVIIGVGIAGCLSAIEYVYGHLRAALVFLAGHVGATLLVAPVIVLAVRHGVYPREVRFSLDYGVSYGAATAAGAATVLLRWRWARVLARLGALALPLNSASWFGALPDYTTLGHCVSVLIGVGAGMLLHRYATPRRVGHADVAPVATADTASDALPDTPPTGWPGDNSAAPRVSYDR